MNKKERAVYDAIEQSIRVSKKAHAKTEAARKALGKECTHPVEAQMPYQWEHDNGYGVQSQHEGIRCRLCGAEKAWKSSSYWTSQNGEYLG